MTMEIKGLYKIIPMTSFRRTEGVSFDILPEEIVSCISGVDRVVHDGGAVSPGPLGGVDRPWYMHPYQQDHLMVLRGKRTTELYTAVHGVTETFEVLPECVKTGGKVIHDGPAILSWPCNVFHRIKSSDEEGSASLNFAARGEGFDIKTNFNIYGLDTKTGKFTVLREGYLDQK
ncbi:MAG: hypothetical protein P9L88_02315 [Candidatus Tantalella remota]|nr:hypothetical protein [Candidatus Tantalella remota]